MDNSLTQRQGVRVLDLGAGPGSASAAFSFFLDDPALTIPKAGVQFDLIDRSAANLKTGEALLKALHEKNGGRLKVRTTAHTFKAGLFNDRHGPVDGEYDLILMSYFLNELYETPAAAAADVQILLHRHLHPNGVLIILEPALKAQSRFLLEVRKLLLAQPLKDTQVLLPCLGHQACGALANPKDFCHEEAEWFRPKYLSTLEAICKLDRKTLPFSYLVLSKSGKPIQEILTLLKGNNQNRHRLVSPVFGRSQNPEFYTCSASGKNRVQDIAGKDQYRGAILEDYVPPKSKR